MQDIATESETPDCGSEMENHTTNEILSIIEEPFPQSIENVIDKNLEPPQATESSFVTDEIDLTSHEFLPMSEKGNCWILLNYQDGFISKIPVNKNLLNLLRLKTLIQEFKN